MRSTKDLIEELETESAQHFTCTLPVAFENTSIMITATDENKQQMLDDAVKLGGIPIGLVIADKQGFGVMDIRARIFPEQPRPSTRSRSSQFGSTINWRRG